MEASENPPKREQPKQETLTQICDEVVRLTKKAYIDKESNLRTEDLDAPTGEKVGLTMNTELGELLDPEDALVTIRIDDDLKSAQEKGGFFYKIYKNEKGKKYIEKQPAPPLLKHRRFSLTNFSLDEFSDSMKENGNIDLDAMNIEKKRRGSGEAQMSEIETQKLLTFLKSIPSKK
jgi:hypothetical protein